MASAVVSASAKKRREHENLVIPWANARWLALGLVFYFGAMLYLMEKRLYWMPAVLPAAAPPELFSEERAAVHVRALAGELPDRQISMPQLRKAHDYIVRQGEFLVELAAARGGDVEVKVFRETASGSIAMDFGGVPFTNAYRELTNIIITITPAAAKGRPGLLVASHHDSAVASPGASDDVSMVAVMLEAARALLSRRTASLPAVPLVLLFDGGEESICQGGHGFFNSSQHARGLGAFINLEAMGAGGLPILFQHTGSWTVAAWAKGARNAHGARIAQDIFDTGLIPGDTDYRMFSARHYGTLPGLDIAFIRDSVAYHTALDNVERLKRGALQDMGETLIGGLMSMAAAMAADNKGELSSPKALRERAVFFDLIGCGMIVYPDSWAQLLHTAPLALFLMMPLSSVAAGHTAAGVMTRMLSAAGRALGAFATTLVAPALLGVLRVLATGVSMSWFSQHWIAYATFLPLAFATAVRPWLQLRREALEQRPLQQGHYVACQVYGIGLVLSALAAGLCIADLQGFSQILAMGGMLAFTVGSLLDNGAPTLTPTLLLGVLALATVPLAALGAILGTFLDVMMERMALTGHHSILLADGLIGVLTGSAVLGYSCCSLLPLAGYALGALFSGGDVSTTTTLTATRSGVQKQRRPWSLHGPLLASLVLASVSAAAWSTYGMEPYTPYNPRRLTITHLHEMGSWAPPDDTFPEEAARAVAAAVAAAEVQPRAAPSAELVQEPPPAPEQERRELAAQLNPKPPKPTAKLALGIVDSSSFTQLFPTPGSPQQLPTVQRGSAVRYDALGHEYASFYPLDRLLGKMVLESEPCSDPPVAVPPYVRKVREEAGTFAPPTPAARADDSSETDHVSQSRVLRTRRVHFRVFSEVHCWGMLNVTAATPLLAWSLPSEPVSAPLLYGLYDSADSSSRTSRRRTLSGYYHMVRFSHEAASPFWDLWVEVDATEEVGADPWVIVELSVTYLPLTAELRAVQAALPEWVTPTWIGTTYHSTYKF